MSYKMLYSRLRVRLTALSPENVINLASVKGIEVYEMKKTDACTAEFVINERDYRLFEQIAQKAGAELEAQDRKGLNSARARLKSRLSLLLCLGFIVLMLYVSSLFVWDIKLVCDDEIPKAEIMSALSDCGLSGGTFWPALDRENIRTKLMDRFPEISWLALNINGSRANVLIKLKENVPEIYDENEYHDIIAARTGIIKSMEVLNGIPQVTVGQAVKEGDLLISGTLPVLDGEPEKIHAKGRVMAQTVREYESVTPVQCLKRGEKQRKYVRFALKFGNKRQNLYFYSGNHIDGCVKIIKEYNLGVDGLFSLPLSIIKEELIRYEAVPGRGLSEAELKENLLKNTLGINVVHTEFAFEEENGILRAKLRAHCLENIAESIAP